MKLIDQICLLLKEEPDNWKQNQYRLTHSSGIAIWIEGGFNFYKLAAPQVRHFSFWEKVRLRRAIKKWEKVSIDSILYSLPGKPLDSE